jgi:cobalt-zinc-cadmium efflux system protein
MSKESTTPAPKLNIILTIALNLILTIVEFLVGILSGSLSLISDATHNSVDIVTLFISYLADRISKNKANSKHSYGYKRAGILASVLNSMILVGMALYIFLSAYNRLLNPQPIEAGWITSVAIVAIIVNSFSAFLISKDKADLNFKSVYLNMFFDTLASVGVLIAGIVISFTNWYWIDSLVSIMIGLLLIKGAFDILTEATDILLEAVPKNINLEAVRSEILLNQCVKRVVDLHIWSMTSESIVLTSVIEINPNCLINLDQDIEKIKQNLKQKFNIDHQTIEARIQATEHED